MRKPIAIAVATIAIELGAVDVRAQTCSCPSTNTLKATSTASDSVSVSGTASGSASYGVEGVNSGASNSGGGVMGLAYSAFGAGVLGTNFGSGTSTGSGEGSGVAGTTFVSGTAGVYGFAASGVFSNGVMGETSSQNASGVYGQNDNDGYGVAGRTGGSGSAIYGDNWSSSGWAGNFNGRVWVGLGLDVNGTCVSGNCSSDERLKTNIKPLVGALEAVAALRPVTFE